MINPGQSFRLLVIDDNEAIHRDLKKILLPREGQGDIESDEALLFGSEYPTEVAFEIDSAYQGQEGLECIIKAIEEGRPYSLAFVDVRMPPGWDGIETIGRLWKVDPTLQIVICTAYSDYNWNEISQRLGVSENFVVLKKPFDIIEVVQLAHAMTSKWISMKQASLRMEELDKIVEKRTTELISANERMNLLAAALEAAANAITITDPKGVIVWTNPAFTNLSGYTPSEVNGTTRGILKSGFHVSEFYQEMWKTISAGKVWRGEIINRRKDGTVGPEEMTITPVLDQDGEITHYIAINQDIAARKRAEIDRGGQRHACSPFASTALVRRQRPMLSPYVGSSDTGAGYPANVYAR